MNNTILPLSEIHIGDEFRPYTGKEIYKVKEIDFNQKMILIEVYKPDIHEFIYSFWTLYSPQTSTVFTRKRRISNSKEESNE